MLRLPQIALRNIQHTAKALRGLATEAAPPTAGPDSLVLTFVCPSETISSKKVVQQVNLPSTAGDLGVLANHVPTIEQLRAGVVEVIQEDRSSKRYFVSGGFAIVNPDSSINITAIEAFPVEQLDVDAIRNGLSEYQRKLDAASNEKDKALAQIGVEMYQAMTDAVRS